jgi:membrane protein YdbS with pleckstrin-like domain
MTEKTLAGIKAVVINVLIVAALIWCYVEGAPPKIVLLSAVPLLVVANIRMYLNPPKIQIDHRQDAAAFGDKQQS